MRKPRDFEAELETLNQKTKALKETKRRQLGDLIVATGADALDMDTLAGGLLAMVGATDAAQQQVWRQQGEAFFRKARPAQGRVARHPESVAQTESRAPQAPSPASKA